MNRKKLNQIQSPIGAHMGTLGAQDNSRALVPLSIKTHRPTMLCFVLRNIDFSNGKKNMGKKICKKYIQIIF